MSTQKENFDFFFFLSCGQGCIYSTLGCKVGLSLHHYTEWERLTLYEYIGHFQTLLKLFGKYNITGLCICWLVTSFAFFFLILKLNYDTSS